MKLPRMMLARPVRQSINDVSRLQSACRHSAYKDMELRDGTKIHVMWWKYTHPDVFLPT